MPNISNQDKSQSDMRHHENHGESGKEHLTKDGQPDHRFKENREDQGNNNPKIDKQNDSDDSSKLADIHTKSDGTADMRYAESKEAVSSGLISRDEVVEDAINGDSEQDSHQKKDGTEDKRYKENRRDQDKE